MKAQASLKNMNSSNGSRIIIRNLARIMDLRVISIDTEKHLLTFVYSDPRVLQKVRQELRRLGFPVRSLNKERQPALNSHLTFG